MMTEEKVQKMILDRVMNRLEGNAEDGGPQQDSRSEQQKKLEEEK